MFCHFRVVFAMRKKIFKSRLLISVLFCLILFEMFKNSTENDHNNSIAPKLNSTTCNLFNSNSKQFKVTIDGVQYPKAIALFQNKSINFECLNSQTSPPKVMLMWNHFHMFVQNKYNFGIKSAFETLNCPVTNCELTNDRTRIEESSLVMFHLRNEIDQLPAVRLASQRWVHVNVESPEHCHLCEDKKFENVFNYSAYYTKDSDYMSVYYGDSGISWEENVDYNASQDIHGLKTKFSASLISNCNAGNMRADYLNELQKFISVDIYGKCGIQCPQAECREFIAKSYLFFFVFENSICRDYVTEKFFDTLRYDVIPVVLGGGDYKYYAPKSAFINVADFETPAHLAEYLVYLAGNKSAYNDYFKWKKFIKYDANHPNMSFLCEMCIQLNLEDHTNTRIAREKRLGSLKSLYGLANNCVGVAKKSRIYNSKKVTAFGYSKSIKLQHSFIMDPENYDYIKKK